MKKLAMFFLKGFGGIIALLFLGIIGLNVYQSMRPAARTMKAAGTVSIPSPFRMRRPFIDYMTVNGTRLYAGYASEGLVGVVDTSTNKTVATVEGLTRVHGLSLIHI